MFEQDDRNIVRERYKLLEVFRIRNLIKLISHKDEPEDN